MGVAGFMLPLTEALEGPGKSLACTPPMDQAFNTAKSALTAAVEHPQTDFPISLMVDASNTHVSAVLQHFHNKTLPTDVGGQGHSSLKAFFLKRSKPGRVRMEGCQCKAP